MDSVRTGPLKIWQMRNRALTTFLLAIILLYGGALRFAGQNWDDFSHTHPDELFLTLLVLPNIGGQNSFTDDADNFPEQQILVRRESNGIQQRDDDLNSPHQPWRPARFSAVEARPMVLATWREHRDSETSTAQNALLDHAVDALLIDNGPAPESEAIIRSDRLTSVDLQSMRCRHVHPHSNGVGGYFDARCSPLNPHNAGHGFFVYGTLPLLLAHYGSEFVRAATDAGWPLFDFQGGHLVWRGISMIFDMLSILAVFALGTRIHNRWVGLLAAAFYASAPLAIQKAHFGTVNAIAAFFVILALYFAVRVQQRGGLTRYLLFGIACGLAVASRINLAPLAGIISLSAAVQAMPAFDRRLAPRERRAILARHLAGLLLAGFGAFLTFRVCNPYAFTGPGFFGLLPNEAAATWLSRLGGRRFRIIRQLAGLVVPPSSMSPGLAVWGWALSFGALGWFGCLGGYSCLRNRPAATTNLILDSSGRRYLL